MPEMIYHLPDKVVYAKPGEFLICKTGQNTFKIYRVHNLYAFTTLVPIETTLGGGGPRTFLSQSSVAASAEPDIRYLATEFEKVFPSKLNALESISQHNLGQPLADRFVDVRQFMIPNCEVYSG